MEGAREVPQAARDVLRLGGPQGAGLPNGKVTNLSIELYLPDRDGNRTPEQWVVAYDPSIAMLAHTTSSGLLLRPTTARRLQSLLDDRTTLAVPHAHSSRRTS